MTMPTTGLEARLRGVLLCSTLSIDGAAELAEAIVAELYDINTNAAERLEQSACPERRATAAGKARKVKAAQR